MSSIFTFEPGSSLGTGGTRVPVRGSCGNVWAPSCWKEAGWISESAGDSCLAAGGSWSAGDNDPASTGRAARSQTIRSASSRTGNVQPPSSSRPTHQASIRGPFGTDSPLCAYGKLICSGNIDRTGWGSEGKPESPQAEPGAYATEVRSGSQASAWEPTTGEAPPRKVKRARRSLAPSPFPGGAWEREETPV